MYSPLTLIKERIIKLVVEKKLKAIPIAYLRTIIRAKPELIRSACFELTIEYPDIFYMDNQHLYLIPRPEEIKIIRKKENKEENIDKEIDKIKKNE